MIIAIPLTEGNLSAHFGHCSTFAFLKTNELKDIISYDEKKAPPHEPGTLPKWLAEQNVQLVLCAGIGPKAIQLLTEKSIKVIYGLAAQPPKDLALSYLKENLKSGENVCDHE